jgi:hypothetical protein
MPLTYSFAFLASDVFPRYVGSHKIRICLFTSKVLLSHVMLNQLKHMALDEYLCKPIETRLLHVPLRQLVVCYNPIRIRMFQMTCNHRATNESSTIGCFQ